MQSKMSSSLEDMLQQILQTEKCAEKRKEMLNQVKAEISACKKQLKEMEETKHQLSAQAITLTENLTEVEAQGLCLTMRQRVLQNQKDDALENVNSLKASLDSMYKSIAEDHEHFRKEVSEFIEDYGVCKCEGFLTGDDYKNRTKELEGKQAALEKELADSRKKAEDLRKVMEEKKTNEKDLEKLQELLAGLQKEVEAQTHKVAVLREQRDKLSSNYSGDSRIQKLQQEIAECNENDLEAVYYALKEEVQQLSRQCWQAKLNQPVAGKTFPYRQQGADKKQGSS